MLLNDEQVKRLHKAALLVAKALDKEEKTNPEAASELREAADLLFGAWVSISADAEEEGGRHGPIDVAQLKAEATTAYSEIAAGWPKPDAASLGRLLERLQTAGIAHGAEYQLILAAWWQAYFTDGLHHLVDGVILGHRGRDVTVGDVLRHFDVPVQMGGLTAQFRAGRRLVEQIETALEDERSRRMDNTNTAGIGAGIGANLMHHWRGEHALPDATILEDSGGFYNWITEGLGLGLPAGAYQADVEENRQVVVEVLDGRTSARDGADQQLICWRTALAASSAASQHLYSRLADQIGVALLEAQGEAK